VPTSVGTTGIDALLTYISAYKDVEMDKTIQNLETDIWALRALLLAQDDGVDKQLEEMDKLYNYGFGGSDGWCVSLPKGLIERVDRIATGYFTDLPNKAIDVCQTTHHRVLVQFDILVVLSFKAFIGCKRLSLSTTFNPTRGILTNLPRTFVACPPCQYWTPAKLL
jgi:hypothetical protein